MIGDAINKAVIDSFAALTPDINAIYGSAIRHSMSDWRIMQQAIVTTSGAASAGIPGLHFLGLAADIPFLMNRMSVCSYGVGAILGSAATAGNILEPEDFAVILARWGGDDSLSNASIAKAAVNLSGHVGGSAATKTLAKIAATNAGILLGKKLGAKAGAKVAGKFVAKITTKAIGGLIPFAGAAIGGGVNLWFITSIADEADAWYRFNLAKK